MTDKPQFNSAQFLAVFPPGRPSAPQTPGAPSTEKADATSSRRLAGDESRARPIPATSHYASAHATPMDMDLPFPNRGRSTGFGALAATGNLPTSDSFGALNQVAEDGGTARTPVLPAASPHISVNAPVVAKDGHSPSLVTPAIEASRPIAGMPGMYQPMVGPQGATSFCNCNRRKGEKCTFCWAWDMRSETSAPSLWSASAASTHISRRSHQPSGHYVIGGDVDACIEGQRLLYVRPQTLTTTGGKVYIELIRTIPQPLYDEVEVLLVAGKQGTVTLKPDAIRKGKKLCVMIPSGLVEEQDYDVRVKFAGKTLHGSFPLEIRAAVEESD